MRITGTLQEEVHSVRSTYHICVIPHPKCTPFRRFSLRDTLRLCAMLCAVRDALQCCVHSETPGNAACSQKRLAILCAVRDSVQCCLQSETPCNAACSQRRRAMLRAVRDAVQCCVLSETPCNAVCSQRRALRKVSLSSWRFRTAPQHFMRAGFHFSLLCPFCHRKIVPILPRLCRMQQAGAK